MIQYREIITCIDSAKGTLISADGAKINRDDHLPRLILSDEVIFIASFVNVKEENNTLIVEPKVLDSNLTFRIIGDCDCSSGTAVMFAGDHIREKSDPANGKIAFHISSSSIRFMEALKNSKQQKGEFVILAKSADPITTVVLAKDSFIAENRPCENVDFDDVPIDEIVTKDELQLLLDLKSPLSHTHIAADITDLELSAQTQYSAGTNIEITENGVINCTLTPSESITYTAGENITISESGVISAKDTKYSAGNGIAISAEGVISCTVEPGGGIEGDFVTQDEFDTALGDINSILDAINGEEI